MITEIFIEEETKELTFEEDKLEEWKGKIDELGLEGQKKLLDGENERPVPFKYMNEKLIRIFKILCPSTVELENYCKTPIPLEVLGIIYLCKKDKYFDSIKVWYDDVNPDPIVIGERGDERYMIARWGDEKLNIDKLFEKAKTRMMNDKKVEIQSKISKLNGMYNEIEYLVCKWLNGDYANGIEYI